MDIAPLTILAYFIPVMLMTFFARALFRLTHIHSTCVDVWWHMHASEEIRRNGHHMPHELSRYSIDTVFDNPPLYPWVFSFVSKETRKRVEWALGPIADTILVLILFSFLLISYDDFRIAFLGGVVFAFSPILIKPDARTFFFSPRPFGEMFAVLAILCSLLFVIYTEYLFFVGAIALTSLVLLTGKFPTQALLFCFIGFSMFYLTLWFMLILLLGLAFAVLVSKGFYLKTIRGHIRHSEFYRKTIVYRHSWTKSVSGLRDLMRIFSRGPQDATKATTILLRNPILNALIFAPFLPLIWLLAPFPWETMWNSELLVSMFVWANLTFILVLFVSLKQLKFLGEAERYEGFGIFPLCILIPVLVTVLGSPVFWLLFTLVLGYSVALIGVNYRVSALYFGVSEEDKTLSDDFFRFLQSLPPGVIICVPVNISPEITFKTKHSTLYWGGSLPGVNFGHDEFNEVFEEFPYPVRRLGSIARKYGTNIIVFSKRGNEEETKEEDYDLDGFELIFENPKYSAYKAKASRS